MKRILKLPIRAHLQLLVLLSVLPALAIILYLGIEARTTALQEARLNCMRFIENVALNHQSQVDSTRQMLSMISSYHVSFHHDGTACNDFLRNLHQENPRYTTLLAADKMGGVFAAAVAFSNVCVGDRKYFKDVVATRTFSVGEYVIARTVPKPVLHFAYPMLDSSGTVQGAVIAGFDLARFDELLTHAQLPPSAKLELFDHRGIRLFDTTKDKTKIGTQDDPGLFARMRAGGGTDIFTAGDPEGTQLVYACRAFHLPNEPAPYLYLRLSFSEVPLATAAHQRLAHVLWLLVIATVLAMAAAWLVGSYGILRVLRRLVSAAHELGKGNLHARTGLAHSGNELNELARSFDEMGDALEQRENERLQSVETNAKLESQLQHAQKMQSVGQLAGGVAHDFNNMLQAILGNVDLAKEDIPLGNSARESIEEIQKCAESSANLVRQLLAFARQQTIAPRALDLNETVESLLKMLRRLIGEQIDLAWLPAPHLWPVFMDPTQVDQLLANLCVNARDAISDVGRITIETGNEVFDDAYCADHPGFERGEYVQLVVSDNGCGIDKNTLAHIFEPFFTTKGIGNGTGLGLSTVYGIVKQNKGFLQVYSEPGTGTIFKLHLPRHGNQSTAPRPEPVRAALKSTGETVLLVEDDPSILQISRKILERLGYTVLSADTPREAIRLANSHPHEINLLMTDVVMPEMNGRDLAGRLLPEHPHLKCLFMSGYSSNVIGHHGVLDEGVHFIQKPFSTAALAAKIRATLQG